MSWTFMKTVSASTNSVVKLTFQEIDSPNLLTFTQLCTPKTRAGEETAPCPFMKHPIHLLGFVRMPFAYLPL